MNPALRRSAAHVFVDSVEHPHLDESDRHHLDRVLRLRVGEIVSVADGTGAWRLCSYQQGSVLDPTTEVVVEPPATSPVTVGFALPKGDRPEWIVQKLTEIGVDHVLILHAGRSVTRWDGDRADRQVAKLTRVAREAAMQSRRVRIPTVAGPRDAIEVMRATGACIAEPGGEPIAARHRCVLIGPEGGWTDAEVGHSAGQIDLGPTILRVETAAVVAAARAVAFAHPSPAP